MKLDLYAPKKLYGTHITAICGWISLLFLQLTLPIGPNHNNSGIDFYIMLFLLPFMITIFFIVLNAYVADWLFKSKIKNSFILNNIFYDIFLDIGISLFFIPIIWVMAVCDQSPKYFLIIFVLFITIRLLKLLQNKLEKNQKISQNKNT